jgi:predicted acetyltransferase
MMTDTTIRGLTDDEMLEVLYWLDSYAFRASPPLGDEEEWRARYSALKGPAYFALFEEGTAVATVARTPMTQQVRGKVFKAGGIMGVVTHPAARRKGYSRRLLARTLAELRDDGRPLSCLYPFRESFYERMGYVTFPQFRAAKFQTSALEPLLGLDFGGEVELMLIGEGYAIYRDYLRQMQQRVHGMAMFELEQTESAQRNRQWLAQAKVGGDVAGLMLYRLMGDKITDFKLQAGRFYYETSQARYLLLQWIARHANQATDVEIWLPPFELPETWLSDLGIRTEVPYFAAMARVVDVAGMGGIKTGPGRFSAQIADPLCPWNEGNWGFATVDGRLVVGPSDGAECTLSIQGLSALIYGSHDPADLMPRGWGDPSPEVQNRMRAMFPPMLPWMHEFF